jgi:hypothetical protein
VPFLLDVIALFGSAEVLEDGGGDRVVLLGKVKNSLSLIKVG